MQGVSTVHCDTQYGVFSIFAEGHGHMLLGLVVTFLRDKYKSVMSRQTNGTDGCLMSLQKVRYHLKVEQLFARRPRRVLVLTYKHQTLHLA
jgi:hypothetical protein